MARLLIRASLQTNTTKSLPSLSQSKNIHSLPSSTPDNKSLLFLLQSCKITKQLFQIHAHFITSGYFNNNQKNPFLASRILKLSTDFECDVDYTFRVFRYVESPDTYCVNTVIKGYVSSSVSYQSVIFYFRNLGNTGFWPNSYTFTPLINACAKSGCGLLGRKCHGQVLKHGFDSVLQVGNSLIHMYGCVGDIDLACKVFVEMSVKDLVSWNSLIDGYVKMGDLDSAHKLFDVMPERNVISWNVMIGGYAKGGNPGCGLKLFREMVKMGLRGSDTSVVSVLTACGRSARLKEGSSVHGSLVRTFLKSSVIVDTSLIDMYCKCGKVEIARTVFDRMAKRNLVCWNAMILGHCISGNPEDGIYLFKKMMGTNIIQPDEITFIGLLCACARTILLNEGKHYFKQMTDTYNLKPNFAHYWCMANLFANGGMIREAEESVRYMAGAAHDISKQSMFWACLLAKSRFKGDVGFGERVANILVKLEPENISSESLLLIVYAVAGRWEDVARIRGIMKEKGIGKILGCSLVDLKEFVHNLRLEDKHVNIMIGDLAP